MRSRVLQRAAVLIPVAGLIATLFGARTVQARPSPAAILRPLCASPAPGFAACAAEMLVDASGSVLTTSTPSGHTPADIQAAYKLPSATAGNGALVAVVDAYDDPSAESDLAVYRSTFGLPPCTSTSGCFQKVDENGGTSYPSPDAGWGSEISLDIDMVSAACPNCKILLVETVNPSLANLGTGVDTAVRLGAVAVSNSYARGESAGETQYDVHYNHPGVMITVASGNGGYSQGATYPASSPYVTAVGGTLLTRDTAVKRGWREAAWKATSSGCSAYEPKPSWQHDTGCANRTVADTSAVAGNIATYDSYQRSGWGVAYGTSAPTPLIAAIYAMAGDESSLTYGSSTYATGASLFDIRSGSTGTCGTYLCEAVPGYDGPTGNGTPKGTTAY